MHRLLQGDVGSEKTIVAALAVLTAIEAGYQAAVMAPTEILAEQHVFTFRQLLEPLGVPVTLLTSSLKPRERAARRGEQRHRHRSEEHTSELQSLAYLVCRLL